MSRKTYETMDGRFHRDDKLRILVIGKSGNGKSALGNAILGRNEFPLGRSMNSTTLKTQYASTSRGGQVVQVVDTPDLINCEMGMDEMRAEVSRWKALTSPSPSVVLLAVRCDGRYTPEEYDIYRQMKQLWGGNLAKRLVVAFTFGDRQDRDLAEDLKFSGQELKSVLEDAGGRYVVFDKTSEKSRESLVYTLMDLSAKMDKESFSPVAVLGTLLAIAVVCCIVFIVLEITDAAIGSGVAGIVLVLILAIVVCRHGELCSWIK